MSCAAGVKVRNERAVWCDGLAYGGGAQAEQGPDGDMGGFTRVLHSGRPDHLMNEIPTHVVDRLSNEHGFVVLSRPNAFVQWLKEKLDDIEEDYILMSEPDHLYLAPIPNLMNGDKPAAFPFFYISPKDHVELLKKYVGADTSTRDILHMVRARLCYHFPHTRPARASASGE